MKPKVFCIGFHKTGTSSLRKALETLGYRVTGPNGRKDPDIAENVLPLAFGLVEQFDAFQDNPWPIIYKELDCRYPGSKFILLRRPTEAWIKSVVDHFGTKDTPMRKWIYGVGHPKGNEDIYTRRYDLHNEQVMKYFEHRPDDLIVMDYTQGDGWGKLCPFLGCEIPDAPYPHANKGSDRKDRRNKAKKRKPLPKRFSFRTANRILNRIKRRFQ